MRKRKVKGSRKPTCSKCKKKLDESRVGKQRYCKKCHAANMRANRPKHSELPEEARKKANCRAYTHEYVRRGKILVMPCWICGSEAEVHHPDYNNPLEVVWLCRKHHLELHALEKEQNKLCAG